MDYSHSIPISSTLGHVDDFIDPLVPDRTSSLAVECWSLKAEIKEKVKNNVKLRSIIRRLQFANRRSTDLYKNLDIQNGELERIVLSLTSENMKLQNDLLEEKSQCRFQARVIESHKATILKLKEATITGPISKNTRHALANRPKESEDQSKEIENLKNKVAELKAHNKTLKATISDIHRDKLDLQATARQLQTELSMTQKSLQAEKQFSEATALAKSSVSLQTGNVVAAEYAELENAYEELHSKFEQLWEEKRVACKKIVLLQKERDQALGIVSSKQIDQELVEDLQEVVLDDASSDEESEMEQKKGNDYEYDDDYEEDSCD